jgi:cell division protein FtsW (lipid II flippase)
MNFPITNNKYLTIHEALILHSGILAFILSSSIQENNINKENQLLSILWGMFILKDTPWSVKILTAFLCILAKFMVCIHHSHKQLVISAVVLFSHHDVQMLCFCTWIQPAQPWCNDNKGHE